LLGGFALGELLRGLVKRGGEFRRWVCLLGFRSASHAKTSAVARSRFTSLTGTIIRPKLRMTFTSPA
jgi:hypothetical protein